MADATPTTEPTPEAVPAPAPDPNAQAAVAGVQLDRHPGDRAGAKAIGVEYGNPYDPDTPPYSVYNDPMREVLEQREADRQAAAENRAKARGTAYRFDGHESPYEWTEVLRTANGDTRIGETVMLSKADFERLTGSGFVLTKTEK